MRTIRVGPLPERALEAAAQFHARVLPELIRPRADEDLVLIFEPAPYDHRGWRLAAVQDLARRRGDGAPPLQFKYRHTQQRLHLLDGVGHGRLALVQHLGRLGITTSIDDGQQRTPLLQADLGFTTGGYRRFGSRHHCLQ